MAGRQRSFSGYQLSPTSSHSSTLVYLDTVKTSSSIHPQPRQGRGGEQVLGGEEGTRDGRKRIRHTPPCPSRNLTSQSPHPALGLAGAREERAHASGNPPCTPSCSLLEGVVERIVSPARKSALLTAGREGYFGWRPRLGGKARCAGPPLRFGGEGWMEGRRGRRYGVEREGGGRGGRRGGLAPSSSGDCSWCEHQNLR